MSWKTQVSKDLFVWKPSYHCRCRCGHMYVWRRDRLFLPAINFSRLLCCSGCYRGFRIVIFADLVSSIQWVFLCLVHYFHRSAKNELEDYMHMHKYFKKEKIFLSKQFFPKTPTGIRVRKRRSLMLTDILGFWWEEDVPMTFNFCVVADDMNLEENSSPQTKTQLMITVHAFKKEETY